jgi:hypothetical protein
MPLSAKILLTPVMLGYSHIPVLADFNKTRATNRLWTPHAMIAPLAGCGGN